MWTFQDWWSDRLLLIWSSNECSLNPTIVRVYCRAHWRLNGTVGILRKVLHAICKLCVYRNIFARMGSHPVEVMSGIHRSTRRVAPTYHKLMNGRVVSPKRPSLISRIDFNLSAPAIWEGGPSSPLSVENHSNKLQSDSVLSRGQESPRSQVLFDRA
jgi:hypothetical protein